MVKTLMMMFAGVLISACSTSDRTEKPDSSAHVTVSSAVMGESRPSDEGPPSDEGEVESRGLRGKIYEPTQPRPLVPLSPLVPNGAVACTKDQGNPQSTIGRDLDGDMWSDPAMTNNKCRNFCAHKRFVFAGTQYGSYCFCGATYGKIGPALNCNMGCSGNGNEMCGGAWANSVSLSGAEPTVPPAPSNGSQCVVSGRGTLQHANPKVVGTYRYLEIQRWEVTGPPTPNGTGYLIPILWITTGSGSLHEEDGTGVVTDIKWGISGARRGALQQIRWGNDWKINRAGALFSIAGGIVETVEQTVNGVAKPVVINRSPANEVAYSDILTYGQNIGVQHHVGPVHGYTWHRKPSWAVGAGGCEAQITLGHP
jgi:hypothetical protein